MVRANTLAAVSVILILAGCLAAAVQPASPASAAGKVYIVDQHHPKASDKNPGTSDAPWKTIGKAAATVRAGHTVCVMEGNYPERIKLAHSGAEGKPIVFKGLPRRTVKMQGFDTTGCDWLRIEGFFITDCDIGVNLNSDHVLVVDNRFENVKAVAVDAPDIKGDKPVDAYVAFNMMFHCGKGVVSGGTGWLVERNEITRLFYYGKGDCDYTRPFGNKMVFRQNSLRGSTRKEVAGSHVDAFQVFDDNYYVSRDVLIEENVCGEFAQGLMMEVHHPDKGTIKNWTFRRNILFQRGVEKGWAHAAFCGGCEGFYAYGNTIITGGCGYSGAGTVRYENNILYGSLYYFQKGAKDCSGNRNLVYVPGLKNLVQTYSNLNLDYDQNVTNEDPLFQDLAADDVRLKKGSPAIGTGVNGVTIGAVEYPIVYYVDQRHGGATDSFFGYPGAPFKTIAKALSVAEPGETVLIRGGVYRELVKPTRDGVNIKAMKGEKVIITGADEISSWKRHGEKWAAPLAAKPTKVLRDGLAFKDFSYDEGAKSIIVSGFDPRLSLMETVVRQNAIDLTGAPGTKIEAIDTASTLGEAVAGNAK